MIVYMRTDFDGEVCTYFLGLVELKDATAAGLECDLMSFLHDIGLTDEIMSRQFVGFCSDGASCMIGQHRGGSQPAESQVLSTPDVPLHGSQTRASREKFCGLRKCCVTFSYFC